MRKLIPIVLAAVLVLSCSKNAPPVIEYFVAEPDSVFPGDTVTITFRASDADGDGIQYMLGKSSGTWGTDFGSIEPTKWIAPKEPGDHYLTLMVGDLSDQVTDSVLIHVFDTVGFFTDARDGHQYKWVKIGEQVWMAENLAYLPGVNSPADESYSSPIYYVYSYWGDNVSEARVTANYGTYGILYNVKASKSACPSGWHLPSDDEWKLLETYLGMNQIDVNNIGWRESGSLGSLLKSDSRWEKNGNGNNGSGFNALAAGGRFESGFGSLGYTTAFWSSFEQDATNCWGRYLDYQFNGVFRHFWDSQRGFSVRCVKDE